MRQASWFQIQLYLDQTILLSSKYTSLYNVKLLSIVLPPKIYINMQRKPQGEENLKVKKYIISVNRASLDPWTFHFKKYKEKKGKVDFSCLDSVVLMFSNVIN